MDEARAVLCLTHAGPWVAARFEGMWEENYNGGSQCACMNLGLILLYLGRFRGDLGKISTARCEHVPTLC